MSAGIWMPSAAAVVESRVGAMKLPALFFMAAMVMLFWLA